MLGDFLTDEEKRALYGLTGQESAPMPAPPAPVVVPVMDAPPEESPVLTGRRNYQGGFSQPEGALPLSPEIIAYLEGKPLPGFSPDDRRKAMEEYESRKGLGIGELIANLGSAISGTGGMAYTPIAQKLDEQRYRETVGRFDENKSAEEKRLMDIANYLRLHNRPVWSAESDAEKMEMRKAALDETRRRNDAMTMSAEARSRMAEHAIKDRFPFQKDIAERREKRLEAAQGWREVEREETQVQQYQRDLTRAGVPEATSIITTINRLLPETGDVPGWKSGQFLPDASIPSDALPLVAAIRAMFNITLKNRSGAAVTDQELERLKGEFFAGKWATSAQLRQGIKNYEDRLRDVSRGIAGGYTPETQKQYLKNIENAIPLAPHDRKAASPVKEMTSAEKLMLLKELMEKRGQKHGADR